MTELLKEAETHITESGAYEVTTTHAISTHGDDMLEWVRVEEHKPLRRDREYLERKEISFFDYGTKGFHFEAWNPNDDRDDDFVECVISREHMLTIHAWLTKQLYGDSA